MLKFAASRTGIDFAASLDDGELFSRVASCADHNWLSIGHAGRANLLRGIRMAEIDDDIDGRDRWLEIVALIRLGRDLDSRIRPRCAP